VRKSWRKQSLNSLPPFGSLSFFLLLACLHYVSVVSPITSVRAPSTAPSSAPCTGPPSVGRVSSLGTVAVPDTQALQSPSLPDQPALHTQYEILSLAAAEPEFAGHERHSNLSPLRYEPCAQRTHVTAEGCEYSPTPQSVHCADPGISLYLPGTQLAQSPFLPDQPALLAGHARQYVDATTNSEYSPTLQSVHGIGPLWALCSPTPQPVQLPFVPVQPGLRSMLPRVVWRASHSIHTAYTMRAPDTHRRQERPGGSGIDGSVTPDQLERAASHFYLKEIIQAIC